MPSLCTLDRSIVHTDSQSAIGESNSLCIIRDMTNTEWQSNKVSLNLPASTTGQQLLDAVAKWCHYELGSFELILQRMPDGQFIIINDHPKSTLSDMGFRCGSCNRNNLIIGEKNGTSPKRLEVGVLTVDENSVNLDDLLLGASPSPVTMNDKDSLNSSALTPPSQLQEHSSSTASDDASNSVISPPMKHDTGYVGLVNQAMTCYLNSLLQTLYMTPEFRNALYRWEYTGNENDKAKSIPFQLQRLFLNLQTSKRHAVETTKLTQSFGWDSSEAWQQHDVQELCRVMFDALEQTFCNTDQRNLINHLYQGKLKDYVKCLECGFESAREDTYLDIPLPVRPFDTNKAYGSVEEALQGFVHPEVLNGSNQYFCDKCTKKCDAHKGLKFITFPYLLTLQLKRFDFDYTTLHRIKLNDKVTFPEILNLNSFIHCGVEDSNNDMNISDGESSLHDISEDNKSDNVANNHHSDPIQTTDNDEGIDIETTPDSYHSFQVTTNEKNRLHSIEKGPYVYELFSIMVHSGSANGGHYYAYIKSFYDGHWYCFNDQNVSQITHDDIRKTYGGGPARSYYSGAYSSSTNAYMLMYRQINKQRNAEIMQEENFPVHINALLKTMQDQEELDRQKRVLEHSMCKIKLFWNNTILRRVSETILKVHKDTTLTEATRMAHTILGLEGTVPLSSCRLIKYDDSNDSLECSFEGSEDKSIVDLLGGTKSNYRYSLLLEVWPPDKQAPVYRPGGTTVKVFAVNLETEQVETPVIVRSYLDQTVGDFKAQVIQELGLLNDDPHIVLERYYNDIRPLDCPSKTLKAVGFYRSNKVFIERSGSKLDKTSRELTFKTILDRYEHTITLYIVLPGVVDESPSINEKPSAGKNLNDDNDIEGRCSDVHEDTGHNDDNTCIYLTNGCQENTKPESEEVLNDRDFDGIHTYHGQLVCSDQSEEGSLTDSDRTLLGSLPRLNGECQGSNASNPETLPVLIDSNHSSDKSENSSYVSFCEFEQTLSSPEDNSREFTKYQGSSYNWEESDKDINDPATQNVKWYFHGVPYRDSLTNRKMLQVHVDKRIKLGALKKELEPYVGVPTSSFKVFRLYSNDQEFECTRLNENLMAYTDDSQLIIRVGRALRKGEYRVKIFQLLINEPEPSRFLIDWILLKGTNVLQAKKDILKEISAKCNLDIPLERCRLRKKSWKTPSTIFFDTQKFGEDINIFDNSEIYVEILADKEKVVSLLQMSLYVRRWHPSSFKLDPMIELVLEDFSVDHLKNKLSKMSGIPPEYIDFAKIQGSFPCEISLLTLHTDLAWNPQVNQLNCWPLYICDDGFVIAFKDRREVQKYLTDEERKEIITKENSRLYKPNHGITSSRQEKALKIYMDNIPNSNSASNKESV